VDLHGFCLRQKPFEVALKPAGFDENGLSVVWKAFGVSKKVALESLKIGEIEWKWLGQPAKRAKDL